MDLSPALVWLRDDLRVSDNPALRAAVDRGGPVIVLYLLDEVSDGIRPHGGASRWWLHNSLASLAASVKELGAELILRRGSALVEIPKIVKEADAGAVYWNRRYAASRNIDATLKAQFTDDGLDVKSFQASLLFEPWTVSTATGTPYRVFTPFWRACLEQQSPREPFDAPAAITPAAVDLASDDLADWALLPTKPDWAGGLRDRWTPGEASAHESLERFVEDILEDYHRRDEPAHESTSSLSPHLRFGEISPFQVWHRLHGDVDPAARKNAAKFLSEIGWREFNWSILFTFPELATKNYRSDFDAFPWEPPRQSELEAWQQGRTGIPLVDAGMRELWQTGYMHNRVRMVAASFLIKNLLVDWRIGEQWFWDCLVDADEASNPGNWQWVAGSGADAAPYFRVFNPVLQADKFDRERKYISRWLPDDELATPPIVDLAQSRRDALTAYEHVKGASRAAE